MTMAKINLKESFRVPLEALGKTPVVLVPLVIFSVVSLLPTLMVRRAFVPRWEVFFSVLVSEFLVLLGMSWVTLLLARYHRTQALNMTDLQESWIELSQNLRTIAMAIVLVAVITSFGFFLYVVPGILLEAIFLIVVPQVAVEKSSFDKSLAFMTKFVFAEQNLAFLLLYVLIAFALGFVPVIGAFLGAFFLMLFFPYLYLRYGRE